jgi:K+-transporting ATPase ATPase C chain
MKLFITALLVTVVLTLLLGVIYPLAMTGVAQLFFNEKANGSLVSVNGTIVGSSLIGQTFADAKHFHSRPSAAGDGYDPMKSGGSNLGPTSAALHDRVKHDVDSLRQLEPTLPAMLPSDMLTTSGSGLDPDISVANAMLQTARVAKANGLAVSAVEKLVQEHMHSRTFGLLGESTLNVLELNVALAKLHP